MQFLIDYLMLVVSTLLCCTYAIDSNLIKLTTYTKCVFTDKPLANWLLVLEVYTQHYYTICAFHTKEISKYICNFYILWSEKITK